MTRKKVKLAYIINDTERRASFKKRKKGLIKKVSELSTLCGVDACAIIYSPFDAEPEVLARFASMSIVDRTRKMVDQESLTRHRIKKANGLLERLRRENKCRQIQRILFDHIYNNGRTSHHIYLADFPDFVFVINQTVMAIKEQKERREKLKAVAVAAPMPPPPPPVAAAPQPEVSFGLQELPLMSTEELEGYPWHLVESPEPLGGLDDDEFGYWDDEMSMHLNNFLNNNNNGDGVGPSGTKPGDDDGGNKTLGGLDDGWDDENLMQLNFFFDNNSNGDGAGPSGTKPGDDDGGNNN